MTPFLQPVPHQCLRQEHGRVLQASWLEWPVPHSSGSTQLRGQLRLAARHSVLVFLQIKIELTFGRSSINIHTGSTKRGIGDCFGGAYPEIFPLSGWLTAPLGGSLGSGCLWRRDLELLPQTSLPKSHRTPRTDARPGRPGWEAEGCEAVLGFVSAKGI